MEMIFKNLKTTLSKRILSKFNEITNINRHKTYFQSLKGKKGLEIGGPSQIFNEDSPIPIYPRIGSLDGCNFSENTIWHGTIKKGNYYEYYNGKKGYQFICDAVDLSEIESNSYEFILASHVLEHIANPFKAISEWLRVLKDEGILLIIVPSKDNTFDHKRSVTTIAHLIEDFKQDTKEEDLSHLNEIIELHDFNLHNPTGSIESFKDRSLNNYENRCLHHHVFDIHLIYEVFNYFNIKIISSDFFPPDNIVLLGKKQKKE